MPFSSAEVIALVRRGRNGRESGVAALTARFVPPCVYCTLSVPNPDEQSDCRRHTAE